MKHWKSRLEKIESLASKVEREDTSYHIEPFYWLAEHDKAFDLEQEAHGKEARQIYINRMIVTYKMLCWTLDIKLCGRSDCTIPIEDNQWYCKGRGHRSQVKSRRYRKRHPDRAQEAVRKYYRTGG